MKGRQPSNEYISMVIFEKYDITQFILLVKPCLPMQAKQSEGPHSTLYKNQTWGQQL